MLYKPYKTAPLSCIATMSFLHYGNHVQFPPIKQVDIDMITQPTFYVMDGYTFNINIMTANWLNNSAIEFPN
jgi:hypothetical protein